MHSDDDEDTGGLAVLVEDCLVDLALLEAEGAEDADELLIPPPASLLESVQGLVEPQDMPTAAKRHILKFSLIQVISHLSTPKRD